ncbi:TetR/AcrR family transcriptional regulator [Shewanella waksmanii]|uniref:TetR/AcrR family transcriptional regulator n=1 Tax=Shewanella waksmanii TaxID=213783 RepID=UPI00048C13A8|nr:TetR/AcrR family transcriptional regulator [Shewanella waksmanii]
MSNWEQRGQYLVEVAQRCLKGHKSFDLCRSHLVKASQISKGTIYNHFPSEADLIVAVAVDDLQMCLAQAQLDEQRYSNPFLRFLYHHCWRLHHVLSQQKFVIQRVMPNEDILNAAGDYYRDQFNHHYQQYKQWLAATIAEIGLVEGFDRHELVSQYLRGAIINCDDDNKSADDPQLYHQYSYAITHLLGHSDKRIPTKAHFSQWLQQLQGSKAA